MIISKVCNSVAFPASPSWLRRLSVGILCSKLMSAFAIFSRGMLMSPLGNTVKHVVSGSPNEKVFRVETRRIVAMMKNRPLVMQIHLQPDMRGKSVSANQFPFVIADSVSIFKFCSTPVPASSMLTDGYSVYKWYGFHGKEYST